MPALTIAQAFAAFAGRTLATGTTIADTARHISDNIDGLQNLTNAGLLTAINPTIPGRAALQITPAQVTSDAGALALVTGSTVLQQRVTAAAAAGTALNNGFIGLAVVDTAANVVANLDSLEALIKTGQIAAIRLTDAGTPVLSVSAATLSNDANALAAIALPFTITLTDPGAPTLTLATWQTQTPIFTNVLAHITTPYNVASIPPVRAVELASAESGIDRSINIFSRATQPATGVPNIANPNTGLLPFNTTALDGESAISTFFDSLEVAAKAGKINSIVFSGGGIQTLSLTPTQLTNDPDAIAKLNAGFTFSEVIGATATPALDPRFSSFTVSDSATNVLANLDALDALVRAGDTPRIRVIGTGAPALTLTAAQLGRDITALSEITETTNAYTLSDAGTPTVSIGGDLLGNANVRGAVLNTIVTPFHLAVTGAVSAGTANAVATENNLVLANLTTPLAVFDYAANVANNLAGLQILAAAGKITSITLEDGTLANLNLTPAQITANAAALAVIVTPHTNTAVTSNPLSTSAANLLASLASLEAQAEAGTLGAITLNDGGTPALSLSAATLAANALALGKITSKFTIALTDAGTPTISFTQSQATFATLPAVLKAISTPFNFTIAGPVRASLAAAVVNNTLQGHLAAPLAIADFAANIDSGATPDSLQVLAGAGLLGAITLSDGAGATLPFTATQATADAGVLAAVTTPNRLSQIVTVSAAGTTTLPNGRFVSLTVQDTAANITAGLDSLETLTQAGKVAAIEITGASAANPVTLSLSAAALARDIDALNRIPNATFNLTLTDPGTPNIALTATQVGFAGVPKVLTRVTGPFTWSVTGPLLASRATQIVNNGGGGSGGALVAALSAGALQFRDTTTNIEAQLPALQTLAGASKIVNIQLTAGIETFNLNPSDLTANPAVFAAITAPYLLAQNTAAAGLAAASLATGFGYFAVQDTAANIVANLPALETTAQHFKLGPVLFTDAAPVLTLSAATIAANADALDNITAPHPVVLTDAGTPTVTLQAYQLNYAMRNDVLNTITGAYKLAITGQLSAGVAASVATESNTVLTSLTAPIPITDYTYNLAPNIDFLEALAKLNLLGNITLIDDPTPTLTVFAGQQTSDADVLAKITTPFHLALVACFAQGTHILTTRGEIRVQDLQIGDILPTANGAGPQPIIWIGRRTIDITRHPDPEKVRPIRVRAGAFSEGQPARDLRLSPDHAVYLWGKLIPIRCLINGTSIIQEPAETITYFHIELPRHAIILAEQLPTESFLDLGNRAAFENAGETITLHPDFYARIWDEKSCAELILGGPVLTAARTRLEIQATWLEQATFFQNRKRFSLKKEGPIQVS